MYTVENLTYIMLYFGGYSIIIIVKSQRSTYEWIYLVRFLIYSYTNAQHVTDKKSITPAAKKMGIASPLLSSMWLCDYQSPA